MRTSLTRTMASGANGQLTEAILASGQILVGFITPATWVATDVVIQGSVDGVIFYDLYDSTGAQLKVVTAVNVERFYFIEPAKTLAPLYYQLKSVTTQGATRILKVILVNSGV